MNSGQDPVAAPASRPSRVAESLQSQQMSQLKSDAERAFTRILHRATYRPIAGLLLFVVLLTAMIGYLVNEMTWVNYTNRIIAAGLDVERKLLDVQSGIRGYFLTFDDDLLQPAIASRPAVPVAIGELQKLVAHNPSQLEKAQHLETEINRWLAATDSALASAKASHQAPSQENQKTRSAMFDDIRDEVSNFQAIEYSLRDQRTAGAIRTGLLTVGLALGLAAFLGVVQAVAIRRGLQDVTGKFRDALELNERRAEQIKQLVRELDIELKAVAEIQRSLLPMKLPSIPTLQLAASYQTSRRAGGDYYDFFRLPKGESVAPEQEKWGILIADVSGHGTPAAVLMAVTHAIAHGIERPLDAPSKLLEFVNDRLCAGYTVENSVFVTAFFGIYDPASRTLEYSSAGHNPPRLLRGETGTFTPLDEAQALPLGIMAREEYLDASIRLQEGDTLVLYTDGWTEARPPGSTELFGEERLDEIFLTRRDLDPTAVMEQALADLDRYTGHQPPLDDRTLLVLHAAPMGHDDGERTVSMLANPPTLLESVEAINPA